MSTSKQELIDSTLTDLVAETAEFAALIEPLSANAWKVITTREGWSVAHQVAHLLGTDRAALMAIVDPAQFYGKYIAVGEAQALVDEQHELNELTALPHAELFSEWQSKARELGEALRRTPADVRIPWFGPPMSRVSMATARLMETWAHSIDVYDALDLSKPKTDRVRHVCDLGIRTRKYVHYLHELPAPASEIRVELRGPSGRIWAWGDSGAREKITGSAWDFALLATRRRHRTDTDVLASGPEADHWLNIIQTFAGDPGADPLPLTSRQNN